jgi:aryl-alcohol dehydrogenase-like predicted oxidoreductase
MRHGTERAPTGTARGAADLALGTARLGLDGGDGPAFALLDTFVERGGARIDTARVYSDWVPGEAGRSERIIGEWMRERGNRRRLVIATKGGHPPLDDMGHPRLSPRAIRSDLEASLRALGTDFIDIYYLHRDDPGRSAGAIVETLEGLAREGLVRSYACSNWSAPRIREAAAYAREHGYRGFAESQVLWNIGSRFMNPIADPTMKVMDDDLVVLHRVTGLAAVAYSPQAGGFFSRFDAEGGRVPEALAASPYATPANLRLAVELVRMARELARPVSHLVLAWLFTRDIPVLPIVGCRTLEQLADSIEAAGLRLDPAVEARLDTAADDRSSA